MAGSGTGTPISVVSTFVVEDGSGKSNANSYLSVADADTYDQNFTRSSSWTSASQTTKQNALIRASQYLDNKYHNRWRGLRANETQALDWPRSYVEDDDEYTLLSTTVPQKLKDACAELAVRVVSGDDLLGAVTSPGDVTSETVSIGPISESKTYAGGKPHQNQYPRVNALLRALIEPPGMIRRG